MSENNLNKNELSFCKGMRLKLKIRKNKQKNVAKNKSNISSVTNQIHIEKQINGIPDQELTQKINQAIRDTKIDDRLAKVDSEIEKINTKIPKDINQNNQLLNTLNAMNDVNIKDWSREKYKEISGLLSSEDLKYILIVTILWRISFLIDTKKDISKDTTLNNVLNINTIVNDWIGETQDVESWFKKYSDTKAFSKLRNLGLYNYTNSRKMRVQIENNEVKKLFNKIPNLAKCSSDFENVMLPDELLHIEASYWIVVALSSLKA